MELTVNSVRGNILINGSASGSILKLDGPLSFWGGVDPELGIIGDPRHPNSGQEIAGRILAVPATVGSSSSSAVMLELLRNGTSPSALLLRTVDSILTLGIVVARELGYPTIPALSLSKVDYDILPTTGVVRIEGSVASW